VQDWECLGARPCSPAGRLASTLVTSLPDLVPLQLWRGRLPSVFRWLEGTGELLIPGWLLESSGWFGPPLQVVYCPPEVLLIFRSAA
jgi:hypothetical protein